MINTKYRTFFRAAPIERPLSKDLIYYHPPSSRKVGTLLLQHLICYKDSILTQNTIKTFH